MKLFTQLYWRLDESNRTSEKLAALEEYFRTAPPEDAVWGLAFLTGNRPGRAVSSRLLREWVSEAAGLPLWLVEECYDAVGDLSETIALLLPEKIEGTDVPLHTLVESTLVPLKGMEESERKARILDTWERFNSMERFVWHKMMLGGFRVGVSKTLVSKALANVVGVQPAEMAHRLMGNWSATVDHYARITGAENESETSRPYPFYLAHPLEGDTASLGDPAEWQVEWKWDGIRAQLIRRAGEVLVWSRGEELIHDRFPEVNAVGKAIPDGTVLDGEILAWRDGAPLPFATLQTRIGRKKPGKKTLIEAPVVYMAFDILEHEGRDLRAMPLHERRIILERLCDTTRGVYLELSPTIICTSWDELAKLRESARDRLVEGFMLKRSNSDYKVGRVKGDWWKWKVDPLTVDAVMIYAQRGSGRRASLFTDYTFGVWDGDVLVPFAKAYSGLTDAEIRRVDDWIKKNTLDKHGPVRVVKAGQVFELAFEGIRESKRHKSGIAVRFPRIARWRQDKSPKDADTLEAVRALLKGSSGDR